jgi:hypothetical protein
VDGLQGAGLAKGDVVAQVELQLLKNMQTPHGQISLQIRHLTPAHAAQAAGIDPRRFRGDIAPLQQGDVALVLGQMIGGRGAGDTAAYN